MFQNKVLTLGDTSVTVFRAVTLISSSQNYHRMRMRANRVEMKKSFPQFSGNTTNTGSSAIHPLLEVQNFKIHQKCNRIYIFELSIVTALLFMLNVSFFIYLLNY